MQLNKIRITGVLILLLVVLSGCSAKSGNDGKGKEDVSVAKILEGMLMSYPDSIRTGILSDTEEFLSDAAVILRIPSDMFLMADKKHSLGEDYIPSDLVDLSEYPGLTLSRKGLKLRKIVLPDLLSMVHDAGESGISLVISSAYRSYSYQKMLFEREVRLYGLETAERESARPGTSQHQLGVTLDFGSISDDFADTPAGRWLHTNGWKYGFSLSYPEGYEWLTGYRPEIWHYRYVTPAGTAFQRKYFNDIQQYMLMFINDNRDGLTELISR